MVLEPKNWSLFYLRSLFSLVVNSFSPLKWICLPAKMDLYASENGFARWQPRKDPLIVIFALHLFWRRHSGVKEKSVNSEQGLRCRFAPFELQILQMLNWTNCQRAPIAKKLQLPGDSFDARCDCTETRQSSAIANWSPVLNAQWKGFKCLPLIVFHCA